MALLKKCYLHIYHICKYRITIITTDLPVPRKITRKQIILVLHIKIFFYFLSSLKQPVNCAYASCFHNII